MYMRYKMWEATVGSHMWGMNHAGSDIDMFVVEILDTRGILAGYWPTKGTFLQKDNIDLSIHEIGQVVKQLMRGNINYLWGLMSPHVECFDVFKDWHKKLQNIVMNNLSKNFYHAIAGMVRHNLKKYYGIKVEHEPLRFAQVNGHGLTKEKYNKKIVMMYRTLSQGYVLLMTKKLLFNPGIPLGTLTLDDLKSMYTDITAAYEEESKLPDKPNPEPFDRYLIDLREYVLENF